MVKNYMEIVVDNILKKILPDYSNLCKCEKCCDDIKAIALNNLKPIYVVTNAGNLYAKVNELEIQFSTDIVKELVKAIDIVSKNPHHNS
ncbi:late competence development ComFB family protein [Clostridium tunisiense]|uniref:late competence development ComFB family protein n=1 Tax=Clostridium tunisiense TaxID=219748 RepID=UPI0002E7F9B0|nr:late competence development ComFB family protein [Clostridium tunisiense]